MITCYVEDYDLPQIIEAVADGGNECPGAPTLVASCALTMKAQTPKIGR
jgi:hypothetical protein